MPGEGAHLAGVHSQQNEGQGGEGKAEAFRAPPATGGG